MKNQFSLVMGLLMRLKPIRFFVREANRVLEAEAGEMIRRIFGYHPNDV